MTFFADMADLAREFADSDMFADATITRQGAGQTYDPRLGEYSGSGTEIIGCRAVADDVRSWSADGRIVFETVLTMTVEPLSGDRVTIGSREFIVDAVTVTAPDGNAILYTARVK